MDGQQATVLDVARRARSSRSTVSRYVNDPASVAPATGQRIAQAMSELDYAPSPAARALRLGRAPTVTLIVGDLTQTFFGQLAYGVGQAAASRHLGLTLIDHHRDVERLSEIVATLTPQVTRGAIIATAANIDTPTFRAALRVADERGVRLATAAQHLPGSGVPAAVQDFFDTALEATKTMFAQGHARVALVGPPATGPHGIGLDLGYREALKRGHNPHGRVVTMPYEVSALPAREVATLVEQKYTGIVTTDLARGMAISAAFQDFGAETPQLACCEWAPPIVFMRPTPLAYSVDYIAYGEALVRLVTTKAPSSEVHRFRAQLQPSEADVSTLRTTDHERAV